MGKKPNELENLNVFEGRVSFRFWVMVLISMASMNPRIVTVRAVSFRWRGIVIWGSVIGGIL